MTKNKGLNKKETIEALINSFVFALPSFAFYLNGNKVMSAFSAMASLFNLYVISLSKSGKKSTLIGASIVNIITATIILMYYYSASNWFLSILWLFVAIYYINDTIKNKIK
ncbi:MAG: hypothetical protein KAH10_04660 [Flavobacteriales bacterium]|nr:hypothetical protein [Flavobacteriales bacterium]